MSTVADLTRWPNAWMQVQGKVIHVYPLFGRKHEVSVDCWCHPDSEDGVCIHNEDN